MLDDPLQTSRVSADQNVIIYADRKTHLELHNIYAFGGVNLAESVFVVEKYDCKTKNNE